MILDVRKDSVSIEAKPPQQWTRDEVSVWSKWCVEEFAIDNVPPDKFDMNGKALCLLQRSDFMERVPKNGDLLFNALQNLMQKNSGNVICQQLPAYPNIISSCPGNFPFQHQGTENIQPGGVVFFSSTSAKPTLTTTSSSPVAFIPSNDTHTTSVFTPSRARPFVPILPHPQRPSQQPCQPDVPCYNPVTNVPGILSPAPSTADTESASDEDLDYHRANNEMKIDTSGMNFLTEIPPSSLPADITPLFRKQESGMYCRLLWEFIHQLLQDPHYSSYVCWEDKKDFIFRITNPTGLAELWGHQKNRTNMTYEKLSRALRYYYRMNIIKKVSGKRLTYKFMQHPSNIQKGQRGAKPHNKTMPPRSPPEIGNGSDIISNHSGYSSTIFNSPPSNEVAQQALDIAKTLCYNGHVIKSEPLDIPSCQESTYTKTDSNSSSPTSSSTTTTTTITNTLPSPTISNISPNKIQNLETTNIRKFPKNIYSIAQGFDSGNRTSPKQAHVSPPVVKTEPFFSPRPPSEQTMAGESIEEPQDFTMTTLKRKQRQSIETEEDVSKHKRFENDIHLNSNYSFGMS